MIDGESHGDTVMTETSVRSRQTAVRITYGQDIEEEISRLGTAIEAVPAFTSTYLPRWLAVQLLEGDEALLTEVRAAPGGKVVARMLDESLARLRQVYGYDVDVAVAEHRYGFVHSLAREVITGGDGRRITKSDRVDRIVTHQMLGVPIFLAIVWVVFKMITDIPNPYLEWVGDVITGPITNWAVGILTFVGLGGTWLESLFVDGIIAGVGGVLVFVPVLMFLYLALAILEDSGYMARAALVMDRLMNVLGLHGKSFLPMIIGFGCTVPAFYATRTLEDEKDRILTGLLVPFMSCGARLPVYVLFATIFFPESIGLVVFAVYLTGVAVAIVLGIILKNTLFKSKEQSPFVMELPPYRLPTLRGIWFHMWQRTSTFIRNATTIVLAASVAVWFLMAIPTGEGTFADTEMSESAFAALSSVIAPALTPLGFGSWEASGALVTGFVAKEVVISTMAQIYGLEGAEEETEPTTFFQDVGEIATSFVRATVDTIKSVPLIVGINLFEEENESDPTDLMAVVRDRFEETSGGHGALASLAFMVFVLLYSPCMAAIAAERQELGARWMWFSVVGQLILAWGLAFVVFQSGRLLGLG